MFVIYRVNTQLCQANKGARTTKASLEIHRDAEVGELLEAAEDGLQSC